MHTPNGLVGVVLLNLMPLRAGEKRGAGPSKVSGQLVSLLGCGSDASSLPITDQGRERCTLVGPRLGFLLTRAQLVAIQMM